MPPEISASRIQKCASRNRVTCLQKCLQKSRNASRNSSPLHIRRQGMEEEEFMGDNLGQEEGDEGSGRHVHFASEDLPDDDGVIPQGGGSGGGSASGEPAVGPGRSKNWVRACFLPSFPGELNNNQSSCRECLAGPFGTATRPADPRVLYQHVKLCPKVRNPN